jgi:energy-coupling factor transporter transmembrane protein EcfT
MFALLPLVGGVLLGRFAPRTVAIAVQIVFVAIAATILTLTSPQHGGTYTDGVLISVAVAAVSAGTLWLGLRLNPRRASA